METGHNKLITKNMLSGACNREHVFTISYSVTTTFLENNGMKYNDCSELSSTLYGQPIINHHLTNLRVWTTYYNSCKDEQQVSPQPVSKKKFCGSLIHGGTRILVADDNREVRDLLDTLFNQCGFIVVMANNGLDALRKFNDGGFHIVLTDITVQTDKTNERQHTGYCDYRFPCTGPKLLR